MTRFQRGGGGEEVKRKQERTFLMRKEGGRSRVRYVFHHTVMGGAEEAHPYLSPSLLCWPVSFPGRKISIARTGAGWEGH